MQNVRWLGLLLVVALATAGCSNSKTDTPVSGNGAATATAAAPADGQKVVSTPRPSADGPDSAVWDFLESVRTGNDDRANKMLTPLARQKVGETQMVLAPPGTDTARFAIVKVEQIDTDGARVYVDWTDLDYNGKPRTDQTIWMVRHESEGWRIAGMAVPIFENEPMVLMNFEDPADMLRKQKMVHDEIQRRAEQQTAAANGASAEGAAGQTAPQQPANGADQTAAAQPAAPATTGPATNENGQAAAPAGNSLR